MHGVVLWEKNPENHEQNMQHAFPNWELNPRLSCCAMTVLTTKPSCYPNTRNTKIDKGGHFSSLTCATSEPVDSHVFAA